MLPNEQEVNDSMLQFLKNAVQSGQQLSQDFKGRVVETVLRRLPEPAFRVASR